MLNTAAVGPGVYHFLAAVSVTAAVLLLMPMTSHAQYTFPVGYTQCYSCQAGTFVGAEGSGQCVACSPGFYQDSNGSSACNECPEGCLCVYMMTALEWGEW